jgi:hypothetical protein
MDDFIEYIEKTFNGSDLSPQKSRIASTFHLRFELGCSLENGTKERVDKCTERAKTLFEEVFKKGDESWLLIKSWKYHGDAKDFFSPTKGYLQNQIGNYSSLNIFQRELTIAEFDDALNDEGVMVKTNFTTTHIQQVLCQRISNIAYENILRGIANLEMGFEPSIVETVYFVNRRIDLAFYMYDDRGCLIFSKDKNVLKPIYENYKDWLVDYNRETYDRMFS